MAPEDGVAAADEGEPEPDMDETPEGFIDEAPPDWC